MPTHIELGKIKKRKYALNLNTYRNLHFQVNNNLKKEYKDLIKSMIWNITTIKSPAMLEIVYYNGTNRKSDLENNCIVHVKYLLDALVELWILATDDFDTIKDIHFMYWWYSKNNWHVEITVKHC